MATHYLSSTVRLNLAAPRRVLQQWQGPSTPGDGAELGDKNATQRSTIETHHQARCDVRFATARASLTWYTADTFHKLCNLMQRASDHDVQRCQCLN